MAALRLILRFREITSDVDTITAHDDILKRMGHVWWGWWKKETEPDRKSELEQLKNELESGKTFDAILIDTSAERMHRATISDIQLGELAFEETMHVPEYYRNSGRVAAWLRIEAIEKDLKYSTDTEIQVGRDTLKFLEQEL